MKPKIKVMKNESKNISGMNYFLSLAPDILTETKNFLFELMEETARTKNIPSQRREDRIYIISQLFRLFNEIEIQFPEEKVEA
ncbi:hypothetical protein [Algoriphagus formosus]|uniref:Uncharacterized protein n=1 Tax=Algoriphagus formosus TaxID=2007308 RepID=A0A4V3ASA2_9BACT|nr:hypothetical protein [Algoriphagus aquimaris]TDK49717.1 hypothetical protein E1898_02410 [Algoriphagus aquimaris]